jgi:hypothetical protein
MSSSSSLDLDSTQSHGDTGGSVEPGTGGSVGSGTGDFKSRFRSNIKKYIESQQLRQTGEDQTKSPANASPHSTNPLPVDRASSVSPTDRDERDKSRDSGAKRKSTVASDRIVITAEMHKTIRQKAAAAKQARAGILSPVGGQRASVWSPMARGAQGAPDIEDMVNSYVEVVCEDLQSKGEGGAPHLVDGRMDLGVISRRFSQGARPVQQPTTRVMAKKWRRRAPSTSLPIPCGA